MLQTLGVNAKAADTGKHMDVLFTHDTHSHLNSFSTIVDGKQEEVGGFARLKTLIDEQKEKIRIRSIWMVEIFLWER